LQYDFVKTDEQVEQMRQSALLVSKTLSEVAKMLKPGLDTLTIDQLIGHLYPGSSGYPFFPELSWLSI
jgi:methionyl aminopeptidase